MATAGAAFGSTMMLGSVVKTGMPLTFTVIGGGTTMSCWIETDCTSPSDSVPVKVTVYMPTDEYTWYRSLLPS